MKIDQWAQAVDTNLVPMDRTGEPLHSVITPRRFPELPPAMVTEVAEVSIRRNEMIKESYFHCPEPVLVDYK